MYSPEHLFPDLLRVNTVIPSLHAYRFASKLREIILNQSFPYPLKENTVIPSMHTILASKCRQCILLSLPSTAIPALHKTLLLQVEGMYF